MGITASLRRDPPQTVDLPNNTVPPQNSEAYFLMFGGPPITGTQFLEQNVFYVQSQRHVQQPVIPPEFKETVTIQNDLNLLKRSLKITPTDQSKYTLEFEFDSRVPCDVFVHLIAKEFKDKSTKRNTFKSALSFKKKFYEAASGNTYKETNIDLSPYSAMQLTMESPESFECPLVVELRSNENCQITYAQFVQSGAVYGIKFIKQKIIINGQTFELADIYGFDQQEDHHDPSEKPKSPADMVMNIEDVDPDDSKCVICITDQADTAVLPCRHMCMCHGCAKILRLQTNKCPICRTQIDNLIVLEGIEPVEVQEEPSQPQVDKNKETQEDQEDITDSQGEDERNEDEVEQTDKKKKKKSKTRKNKAEEKEPLVEDANTSSSSITQEM
ncbi:E3 ubiquitin-protein ligase [Acrasis kona]|uniref:E3 ubiquitin-protein ligase n=1 Tax=Acrasis kona TaxID=1008807 RepID=A0AAW2YYC3_9EUKA